MLTYVWAGQLADTLRQYDTCVQILAEELDLAPQDATTQLYDEIKAGRVPMIDRDIHYAKQRTQSDRITLPYSPLRLANVASASQSFVQPQAQPLPHHPTPLLGREAELAVLTQHLADPACRLITLTGPGAIGKTRLAIQIAHEQQPQFSEGVILSCYQGCNSLDVARM